MNVLEVGKLYNPKRRQWPETAQYQYRQSPDAPLHDVQHEFPSIHGGQHELIVFLRSPTLEEVKAYQTGPIEFGLVVLPPVILLLFNAGGRWSDAPFSWHLVPARERGLPYAAHVPGERVLCQVFLVDAGTGILRTARALTWSPEFTAAMHAAIREQALGPWAPTVFDRTLAQIYASNSSEDLVNHCDAWCVGGA